MITPSGHQLEILIRRLNCQKKYLGEVKSLRPRGVSCLVYYDVVFVKNNIAMVYLVSYLTCFVF